MQNRSEQLILLKLQGGDREALAGLYNEYQDQIFRFIFYKVTDRETAYDLTQDVFARFIEVVDKDRISNLKAYLYRIARNLVIDFYKKQSKLPLVSLENTPEIAGLLGKESTEARLDLEIVIEASASLKPLWRELILLRIVEGFEYHEIADILNRSQVYIRVNFHRAITALRKIIK